MFFLGYDLGSSSVKACLYNADNGRSVGRVTYPEREMRIDALRPGWAEQPPELWWECSKAATERLLATAGVAVAEVSAIGIAYQMHGLVLVDEAGEVLRPAII